MYIYILLILFFASLLGIIIMIGRKLVWLQNVEIITKDNQEISFGVTHLQKVKHLTINNIKKYEHILLVEILRRYVKFSNFLKNNYQEIKTKIKSRKLKNQVAGEKKEISKFLKIIADYKSRIREIKHKIRKEEDL